MKSSQMLKVVFGIFLLFLVNGCAATQPSIQPSQGDAPAPDVKISIIQRISFIEEENYTRILIEGSETIAPPFYKLMSDPLKIAIDVPNIDLKRIKEPVRIDNGTIGEVLVTQYDDKGRIEIGLLKMANYNISKEDKNLLIDIEKAKETPSVKEVKKEEDTVKEKELEISTEELKKEDTPPTPAPTTISVPDTVKRGKEVVSFSLEQKKDFVTFNIMADGKLENYDSFKLDAPPRLVLDIWGVGTRYPRKTIKIKNPFIKEVRIGKHPDKLRLVFDSMKPQLPPYQINRIDDKLIVSLGDVPQPLEPQILVQEKAGEGVAPRTGKVAEAVSPRAQEQASPSSEGATRMVKANTLTEIDFKQMDHKSRIVVGLTAEPRFESHRISNRMIAVDVKNAFVPKHLQRGLDTSEFESAVNYINVRNVKTGKVNDVRILIKLREEVPFETTREGKALFIDFEKPKKLEAKIEPISSPEKESIAVETKKEEIQKEEEKVAPESKRVDKVAVEEISVAKPKVTKKAEEEKRVSEEGLSEKIYGGRKLSLDFKDADIKNILRLIAEVSNLNIITGEDVAGKVTMRLVDVPWDQALDVILQSRSLGMSRVGNVVRIAPTDTLKKEVQAELEAKRLKERLEDLFDDLIPVNYATAKEIMPQLTGILSDRGIVKVDERTNTLIIKDIPSKIAKAKSLVKSLDTKTPQVMIEARIIEANLTFQEELGVSWGFLTSTGTGQNKTFKVGGGTAGSVLGSVTNAVVNLPAAPKAGSGAPGILEFLFTSKYGIKELDIAISAHESKGDVKVISSPKIATLDNKQASVEQGLRIPYKKITTEGTVSVEFIEANLKLTVRPQVTNDGNIKMTITVKKDAPDFSIVVESTPSIDKKEAITEVLVKDGGVVVIAGIYTIEKTESNEGIPLFGKVPLLGWLFKRQAKEDKRKDLLIFISPKIVKEET